MDDERKKAEDFLALRHYAIDPAITEISTITASGAGSMSGNPIILLESNEETVASGITPLRFGPVPSSGILFPSVIVQVTPEEYQKIQNNIMPLPYGWQLDRRIPRLVEEESR